MFSLFEGLGGISAQLEGTRTCRKNMTAILTENEISSPVANVMHVRIHFAKSTRQTTEIGPLMRRSIRKFNIPPGQPPRAFELVQIPSPRGKKAVQMPHQLVLNCLSSKTNLVFYQALNMPFRERYAVMTPSIFF